MGGLDRAVMVMELFIFAVAHDIWLWKSLICLFLSSFGVKFIIC